MKKNQVSSIVTLAILTAITTVFWIVFNIVRIFTTKPKEVVPNEVMNPINTNYDKTVVDKIQGRLYFDKEQGLEVVQKTEEPEASLEPSPVATSTGSSQVVTSTESAQPATP